MNIQEQRELRLWGYYYRAWNKLLNEKFWCLHQSLTSREKWSDLFICSTSSEGIGYKIGLDLAKGADKTVKVKIKKNSIHMQALGRAMRKKR